MDTGASFNLTRSAATAPPTDRIGCEQHRKQRAEYQSAGSAANRIAELNSWSSADFDLLDGIYLANNQSATGHSRPAPYARTASDTAALGPPPEPAVVEETRF